MTKPEIRKSEKGQFRNPSESETVREQWRFAIRQYSKWYSHAWGTAILAGVSFFALGWVIKGSNPLPSFNSNNNKLDEEDVTNNNDNNNKTAAP